MEPPRCSSEISTTPIEHHYVWGSIIHEGKFTTIRKATDRTNNPVIIKTINKKKAEVDRVDPQREMELLHQCSPGSNGIIDLLGSYETPQHVHVVLEWAEGKDLQYQINHCYRYWTENTTRCFIRKLLHTLSLLHALGIAHRDIKPENILCTHVPAPNGARAKTKCFKLADFDLAVKVCEGTYKIAGTLGYMAPETIRLLKMRKSLVAYDVLKADIWSVGVVMYILVIGCHPFVSISNTMSSDDVKRIKHNIACGKYGHIPKNIPPLVSNLLQSLLEVNPVKRPSATEALQHPWFSTQAKI